MEADIASSSTPRSDELRAPGKREHILRWIEAAVHESTREKRIVRAVEEALVQREKQIDRGSQAGEAR